VNASSYGPYPKVVCLLLGVESPRDLVGLRICTSTARSPALNRLSYHCSLCLVSITTAGLNNRAV
jgi:hypothetical protein